MPQRKKSAAEHMANGTYRPGRHGAKPVIEDAADFAPPEKPSGMRPVAAEFWDDVVKLLAGVVRDRDAPQLEQMCAWWALYQEIEVELMGMEVGTLEYARTLNAVSVASQNFDRIAKRFGLTPLDRGSLKAEHVGPAKPRVATRPKTALDKKGPPKKG